MEHRGMRGSENVQLCERANLQMKALGTENPPAQRFPTSTVIAGARNEREAISCVTKPPKPAPPTTVRA